MGGSREEKLNLIIGEDILMGTKNKTIVSIATSMWEGGPLVNKEAQRAHIVRPAGGSV